MSAQTPREIAFEDIRKGDDIEARWTLDGLRFTRRGVAHHRNHRYWYTKEGGTLADARDWTHYLHSRPAPTEPEGLGAIVGYGEGIEYVSVNRKPGTPRWVLAGLHEHGELWAWDDFDLESDPDSIEVLSEGIEVES